MKMAIMFQAGARTVAMAGFAPHQEPWDDVKAVWKEPNGLMFSKEVLSSLLPGSRVSREASKVAGTISLSIFGGGGGGGGGGALKERQIDQVQTESRSTCFYACTARRGERQAGSDFGAPQALARSRWQRQRLREPR